MGLRHCKYKGQIEKTIETRLAHLLCMKLTFIVPKVAHGGSSWHTSCTAFHPLDNLQLDGRRVQDLLVEALWLLA